MLTTLPREKGELGEEISLNIKSGPKPPKQIC
jgi:hypothetical protein